jgi:hypothetical protein
MEILGQIFALYLSTCRPPIFRSPRQTSAAASPKFAAKPATPAYVKYQQPPLIFEGSAVDVAHARRVPRQFKLFDYGIISLRLTGTSGTWSELAGISTGLVENEALGGRPRLRAVASREEA